MMNFFNFLQVEVWQKKIILISWMVTTGPECRMKLISEVWYHLHAGSGSRPKRSHSCDLGSLVWAGIWRRQNLFYQVFLKIYIQQKGFCLIDFWIHSHHHHFAILNEISRTLLCFVLFPIVPMFDPLCSGQWTASSSTFRSQSFQITVLWILVSLVSVAYLPSFASFDTAANQVGSRIKMQWMPVITPSGVHQDNLCWNGYQDLGLQEKQEQGMADT